MFEIKVTGTIVDNDDKGIYDFFGIESTCPKEIEKKLSEKSTDDVTIHINSGGGSVFAGSEIYSLINKHEGKTIVEIAGICASAATMVASAGDIVKAMPGAMYMIHNVSCSANGDYRVHEKEAKILKTCNKTISEIYQQRTGLAEKELLKLMDEETWLTSREAKEQGFIDEVIGDKGDEPITINNSFATILSEETKSKIRAMKEQGKLKDEASFLVAKNEIEILRMKGEFSYV